MSYTPRERAMRRSIELRKLYGGPADERCEVEFFFYADNIDSALDITNELKKMNYEAECMSSASDNQKFLITGNTPKMKMESDEMLHWSNQMDDLATEFNCEFDGWGALIEKNEFVKKAE